MANAQEVLSQLTNTWSSMLDKFYDSVADEYLAWMAKEYNIDLKTLKEKALPLKEKLLSKATDAVSAVKTTKKAVVVSAKDTDDSKYGKMSRKELIELCKSKSLPVKRKNQDMIDLLKKQEETNSEMESDSDHEPEVEKIKPKHQPVKHTKKNQPSHVENTLIEESMESSDEEN